MKPGTDYVPHEASKRVEALLFMGLEVRAELLLDSEAARGIRRREGVGTIRHLSKKVLW